MNLAHHSLQFVCKLLMAAFASAALLPGLVYSKAPPGATSTLLLVQVTPLAHMQLSCLLSRRHVVSSKCSRISQTAALESVLISGLKTWLWRVVIFADEMGVLPSVVLAGRRPCLWACQ